MIIFELDTILQSPRAREYLLQHLLHNITQGDKLKRVRIFWWLNPNLYNVSGHDSQLLRAMLGEISQRKEGKGTVLITTCFEASEQSNDKRRSYPNVHKHVRPEHLSSSRVLRVVVELLRRQLRITKYFLCASIRCSRSFH